jgi:hypothetical protein
MLAANASAIGNAIANWSLVGINFHRCNRGGSVDAKPASSATALMTGWNSGASIERRKWDNPTCGVKPDRCGRRDRPRPPP